MSVSRFSDTINECLSMLQSGSHESEEKGLQTLASITKVSPQNRTLLAQTKGAISTLATLTNSPSPVIQTLSLLTLFNLSLNPDLKQLLANMEAIYHLNSLITSSCSSLASSLICSLAMFDKNKAKFGVAGTVQLLVKAIECSSTSDDYAYHLLSSLAELVQFHGNCTLAVRAGAVNVLLQLVKSSDNEDLAGTSLTVLGLLVRFDEGLNAVKKTNGIISSMLSVLKGRSLLSKEGAADILIRLFDDSEECVKEGLMLPEFSSVLGDLCVRGSARVRDKAELLMTKIAKDDGTANFQGQGSGEDASDPEGELQKDEVEAANAGEVASVQHEETNQRVDIEHNEPDAEGKEQQYYPRRGGYQNQRGGRGGGGRRGGYPNGRGGRGGGGGRGGYQNGRSQYYDQPGNYYPRNYNYRGRGGRGAGGYGYSNHGAGGQVHQVAGDVGVQS